MKREGIEAFATWVWVINRLLNLVVRIYDMRLSLAMGVPGLETLGLIRGSLFGVPTSGTLGMPEFVLQHSHIL